MPIDDTFYCMDKTQSRTLGFTIVELLVVIVVIGLLAAITIVSYTGVSQRARVASLQSDLINAASQLKLFQVDNGNFPATTDCGQDDSATNKCLKNSPDNSFSNYNVINSNGVQDFYVMSRYSNDCYDITSSISPRQNALCVPFVAIGSQFWLSKNLNVGKLITGSTNQIDNGDVEKWCIGNIESNCTTYGALYQWDETMQYSTTEGSQGICPKGSHIPSDGEYKILEKSLGLTQTQADATGWRGANQGAQLKVGGGSGFEAPYAGYNNGSGQFYSWGASGTVVALWSSTQSDATRSWYRWLDSSVAGVARGNNSAKISGFSVRCLLN